MQDQSQEPQSRVHGSCVGSVDILSEDAWVTWSAIDRHEFEGAHGVQDENSKPALIDSCLCFRGDGVTDAKR